MMLRLLLLLLAVASPLSYAADNWTESLKREIAKIDAETPGEMGVYVKKLADGSVLNYHADRKWYLASTVKVPIAVAVLQKRDARKLLLEAQVTLKKSDYVDGSGPMNWKDPGARVTIGYLLEQMLTQSDSTAADMLLGQVGEADFNRRVRQWLGKESFGTVTTLLQVRRDAYGEVHSKARELSNMQFIELKKFKEPEERFAALTKMAGVSDGELASRSLEEAFERYYARGLNSGTLEAFGRLLEKIERRELLTDASTALLLKHMENMGTGEKRIKAGLPLGTRFAQKTGTQFHRACNVGIARPSKTASDVYIIAACLEKFAEEIDAERGLKRLGHALSRVWATPAAP